MLGERSREIERGWGKKGRASRAAAVEAGREDDLRDFASVMLKVKQRRWWWKKKLRSGWMLKKVGEDELEWFQVYEEVLCTWQRITMVQWL